MPADSDPLPKASGGSMEFAPRARIAVASAVVMLVVLSALMIHQCSRPKELKTGAAGNAGSALILDPGADRTASAYAEFRWSGPALEPGHYYSVKVLDLAQQNAVIAESPHLEEARWQPDAARSVHWPDRIQWELTRRNADGDVQEYNWAYRSRR